MKRDLTPFAVLAVLAVLTSACGGSPTPTTAPDLTTVPSFLALSDIHFGEDLTADQWFCSACPDGDSGQCETSSQLWTRAQAEARRLIGAHKLRFILYLGDLPAHCEDVSTRTAELGTVLDDLQKLAGSSPLSRIPLLFVPGNNDSPDDDYCPFTGSNGKTPFDYASDPGAWPVVNGDAFIIEQSTEHGYYSVYPLGGPSNDPDVPALRVIALNTVMFTTDYQSCGDATSAQRQTWIDDQMKFLKTQLDDAAGARFPEKVLIAMHVPPGVDGFSGRPMWDTGVEYQGEWVQKTFLTWVARHSDLVVGVLTAHTHTNGIRRLHDCASSPSFVELGVSVPAITTDHNSNPAMKLFTFDTDYELVDDWTFYASESTRKDWDPGNRFSFMEDSYPCSTCPAGQTMFERIAAMDTADVLADMENVLLVKSPKSLPDPNHYAEALDVVCDSD